MSRISGAWHSFKHCVDIWLSGEPYREDCMVDDESNLRKVLFGETDWDIQQTTHCPHKYRITVEEIVE